MDANILHTYTHTDTHTHKHVAQTNDTKQRPHGISTAEAAFRPHDLSPWSSIQNIHPSYCSCIYDLRRLADPDSTGCLAEENTAGWPLGDNPETATLH